jgi:hypothetical protein
MSPALRNIGHVGHRNQAHSGIIGSNPPAPWSKRGGWAVGHDVILRRIAALPAALVRVLLLRLVGNLSSTRWPR